MAQEEWLQIDSLDLDARGVARNSDGKVVFVEGALPGEQVQCSTGRRKNRWEQGTLTALRHESTQRLRPAAAARCNICTRRPRLRSSSACSRTTCGTWPA
jgi:tRNA/tmRNA/rRNA uracil-C5-methylase (TrmA/RlmC/RlmD family)